ncbi:hypothetical protein POPTR_010G078950v4 [Populus trichocarpa]|uniref:Uncharacterized protein n=1 Tax=Populus trichocarpa TaxID=3694 RepID=A0ACC0SCJ5_POPTR|nr:hypothetical protein BDE02_10G068800 [Populus trichocarpa]KAI9386785.1 hypothetical protein POPTR_010G078950v4 [Populus trichocarpa]
MHTTQARYYSSRSKRSQFFHVFCNLNGFLGPRPSQLSSLLHKHNMVAEQSIAQFEEIRIRTSSRRRKQFACLLLFLSKQQPLIEGLIEVLCTILFPENVWLWVASQHQSNQYLDDWTRANLFGTPP